MSPQERAAARLKLTLEAHRIRDIAQTRVSDRLLSKAERAIKGHKLTYGAPESVLNVARQIAHQRALRDNPNYLRDLCRVDLKKVPMVKNVHIDTLPYEPPAPSDRAGRAQAALDTLLMKNHRRAMKAYANYAEFCERHAGGDTPKMKAEALATVGLNFQRKRFARLSRRRHCEIWAAIRAHDAIHRGPVASPAGVKRKVAMF